MATAAQATELLDSRKLFLRDGILSGERKWSVVSQTAGTRLLPKDAIHAPGMPVYGDRDYPNLYELFAKDAEIVPVDGANDHYTVSWTYTSGGITGPPQGREEPGYVEKNVVQRAEFADVYRVGTFSFIPDEGNPTAVQLRTNIGGTPIDVQGRPISVVRVKQSIMITEVIEFDPLISAYGAAAGSRNGQTFLGAAPGTIVYVGANSRTVRNGVWSVDHEFVYDPYFHLVQIPNRDQEAEVACVSFHNVYRQAELVFWRQPFPSQANFDALSIYF